MDGMIIIYGRWNQIYLLVNILKSVNYFIVYL